MGITFALRGSSLSPRYVTQPTFYDAWKASSGLVTPAVVADAGTGIIDGNVIDVSAPSGQARAIRYIAQNNFSSTGSYSVLIRQVPRYTGTPTTPSGFLGVHGMYNQGFLTFAHQNTGKLYWRHLSHYNANYINYNTTASWSPTANTVYDTFFSWDGTTGSGQVKFFVDATSFETTTASAANTTTYPYFSELHVGNSAPLGAPGNFDLNELVIWDEVIDPTSVLLESGTGSLNGASRTSFVSVAAFDGYPISSGSSIILGYFG